MHKHPQCAVLADSNPADDIAADWLADSGGIVEDWSWEGFAGL